MCGGGGGGGGGGKGSSIPGKILILFNRPKSPHYETLGFDLMGGY